MPDKAPDSPESIIATFDELMGSAERSNFDTLWQNVNDLVLPTQDFNRQTTPGEERTNKIYDPTATDAVVGLGSTMHTLAMNPSTEWFNLAPADPSVPMDDQAREWLHQQTMTMLAFYNSSSSGFNTASSEVMIGAAAFGTAPFVRDPLSEGSLPKYYSIPLSSFAIDTDPNGTMKASYRNIEYKPKDLVEAFGKDNVSDATLKAAESKGTPEKVSVLHAVFLADREYVGDSPFSKPWASVYIERAATHELRRGGFDHNPYNVFRWRRMAAEIYGRSPAIDLMPWIKEINVITRDALIAGELEVRPPMMIPANSVEGPIRTAPGSLNYYQVQTRDEPHPMKTGANAGKAQQMIEYIAGQIRRGFFGDLLSLPDNDRMTATEIIARQNNRLQVMSPVKARIDQEMLNPVIKADFDLMLSGGMFPPVPESLDGVELKVEYQSPMAIAQQASQANNFLQLMNVAGPLLQADPSIVVDDINASATFRALAQVLNANVVKLTPPEVSAKRKQDRAQAQAQAQQAQVAGELAGASKDAADAVSTATETRQLQLTG